jgi:hypothetical protein
MSSDDPRPEQDELQFDRVETVATPGATAPGVAAPTVTCAVCGRSIGSQYYHANDKPVCASCRDVLLASTVTPRAAGTLIKAGLFGLGAAIAGAAIYYGVIAITNFEIGLVAILIGYMVGYSVRKGAGGRGGRRFQVLALVLTYWSVGLAYTPLAFKQFTRGEKSAEMLADSTNAGLAAPDSAEAPIVAENSRGASDADSATTEPDGPLAGRSLLLGLGMLFVFVFALPVMYIVGSFPGGILSALIIAIGLHQAWSMTGPHKFQISGPYRVGTGPDAPSPQP